MDNKNLRSIPLDERMYNTKVNDLLYAAILKETTFFNECRYISAANYNDLRPYLRDTFNLIPRTYLNHFKKLLDLGLIVYDYKFTPEAYIFPPFEEGNRYQLVEVDTIEKIIEANILHGIKLYAFLLNKFLFYKEKYNFSFGQLAEALGWSKTNRDATKIIHAAMNELRSLGLVNWEEYIWNDPATNTPVRKQRLTFVYTPRGIVSYKS